MTQPRTRRRRVLTGVVVSDKMAKTIVVQVERLTPHPLYRRLVKRRKKVKAHDEQNQAHTGDKVQIEETRPLSKDKRWRLIEILEKAKA
ncbi:MAG: 30S ribosomal protein S17 [Candidatus Omnitrophica bacterium]|nr:30S ribosomal protein S17 [Candidatus Omnitrophota bacterium]